MTNENQPEKPPQYLLPLILTGVMFLVYLFTMAGGITLTNLGIASELSGWNWPQNLLPPVVMVLTYPLRWLGASILPFSLDFFSAICGALTVGLLARSVMLLPHDRTQAQRDRERSEFSLLTIRTAWLPPVLAALACGLQLTFWRNSVDGTALIVDGLLFAYPVRCLLEYRIDGRESWLTKAAIVFGLGIANSWLLMLLLPLFALSLLWIKGVSLFNPVFLVRMALAGLAGMLVCLLFPLSQSMGVGSPVTLGDAMQSYFVGQKNVLASFPMRTLWVLCLTSILPAAIMGIRWASSFGDNSPLGVALARFMFHLVHGVFLVVCLWGAFDSPLSPRVYPRTGDIHPFFANQSWLPLYFLAALSIGYYSGYFLLVFNNRARAARQESEAIRLLNSVATAGIWVCLVVVPLGLLCKNLPSVRGLGSRMFADFGRNLTATLPKGGAILLSDDGTTLALARHILSGAGTARNFLFINTAALSSPGYNEFLYRKNPKLWPDELAKLPRTNEIPAVKLIESLVKQAATHEIYYLHPSFGYYFERFYVEPHGLTYKLQLYTTNVLLAPAMSPEVAAANTAYWQKLDADSLTRAVREMPQKDRQPGFGERLLSLIKAKNDPDDQPILVGAYYSRALNSWGTDLQALGDLNDAGACFKRALELNPLNVVAEINAACNATLRAGSHAPVDLSKGLSEKLNQYNNFSMLLSVNGPFDEPKFCYQEGAFFAQAAHYRQAAREFQRVKALTPDDPGSYLWLAQIYNLWRQPDRALALMRIARKLPAAQTNSLVELVSVEATAYFTKNDIASAESVLEEAVMRNPEDQRLGNMAVSLLLNFQRHETALAMVNQRLRLTPGDVDALINKGVINLQLGHYAEAIPPLDRVLELQPANSAALLNRAIALLQSGRLEDAQKDYESLAVAFPSAYQVYFGLGEIAWRKKDSPGIISNYELYLKYAPGGSDEAKTVKTRLDETKAVAH